MPEADVYQAEFHLPDLGEGLTEAEILVWHASVGDHVVTDQPLVSIETDKAVVEIPAPHSGIIEQLCGEPGTIVQVGEILVRFTDDGTRPDTGAVVGSLPGSLEDSGPAAPAPKSRIRISPKARRRAQELNVDLTHIESGRSDGVIQVEDVENAALVQRQAGEPRLTGVRRAMAERMAGAHASVARATVTGQADIGSWQAGSPVPRLIRAVGVACLTEPILNARFNERTFSLVEQSDVNLGIAMETAHGLFVPVLEDINNRSAESIADELISLEESVVHRRVKPDQLKGQTITLSNFGAVGGRFAEMIVVPPQVAIVGAGRYFKQLVAGPEGPVPTEILPLSVSFDHRVVTGVEACRFLNALTADLELSR